MHNFKIIKTMASREQISIVQSKFTSGETVVIVSFFIYVLHLHF